MNQPASFWKTQLGLKPHPEGGFFKEVYVSKEVLEMDNLPERYTGDRNTASCIYFMLEADSFSAFHRIESDELWHFHTGDALTIYLLDPLTKAASTLHLGPRPDMGQSLTVAIPHDTWFASRVDAGGTYSLVSCTVAPAFSYDDFYLAERDMLLTVFPQHAQLITQLTRG
jgi:uncharacterized protein